MSQECPNTIPCPAKVWPSGNGMSGHYEQSVLAVEDSRTDGVTTAKLWSDRLTPEGLTRFSGRQSRKASTCEPGK
jgi:hypothetical protein